MKCAVVAFERQQVVGSGKVEFLSYFFLAPHRVDADDVPFEIKGADEFGDCRDLVGFPVDGQLTEGELAVTGPGADEMKAGCGVGIFKTVAQSLAVDGDELATKSAVDRLDKGGETTAELVSVNACEDAGKGVVTRNPIGKLEVLFEPVLLEVSKTLEVCETFTVADHRSERDVDYFTKVVLGVSTVSGVFQILERVSKSLRKSTRKFIASRFLIHPESMTPLDIAYQPNVLQFCHYLK